jgi:hypothetical protein
MADPDFVYPFATHPRRSGVRSHCGGDISPSFPRRREYRLFVHAAVMFQDSSIVVSRIAGFLSARDLQDRWTESHASREVSQNESQDTGPPASSIPIRNRVAESPSSLLSAFDGLGGIVRASSNLLRRQRCCKPPYSSSLKYRKPCHCSALRVRDRKCPRAWHRSR